MSERYNQPRESGVEFPAGLLTQFQGTSFCPDDLITNRPEHGTSWNTLRVEFCEGSESEYPETLMYYDCHHYGGVAGREGVSQASRAFASWSGRHDGQFVKAVIDWLQSMTAAMQTEVSDE